MEQILFTTREQESLKAWMDDHGEVGQLIMREQPVAPPLSEPGHSVMYWDAATDTMLCSVDGAPFFECVSAAAGPGDPVGSTQFNDNGDFGGSVFRFHVQAFGTTRQAIQDAIDAAPEGSVIQFDCITYTLDGVPLVVTKSLGFEGCAPASISFTAPFSPGSAPGAQFGTVLNGTGVTPVFEVEYESSSVQHGVTFRNMNINLSAGGTAIDFGPGVGAVATGLTLEYMAIDGGAQAVHATKCRGITITNSQFTNQTDTSVWLQGFNCDDGGVNIIDCNFLGNFATNGIYLEHIAAPVITGNFIIYYIYPLHILFEPSSVNPCNAGPGPTEFQILGNEFESFGTGGNSILIDGGFYSGGLIQIVGNQLGAFVNGTQDIIKITANETNSIFGVTITGNNMGRASAGFGCVSLHNVLSATVATNTCDTLTGDATSYVVKSDGIQSYGVMVGDNAVSNPFPNMAGYQGSNYTLHQLYSRPGGEIMSFATLPAVLDGSMTWCPDCSTTNPCTGGGTGTMAYRRAGAWECSGAGITGGVDHEVAVFTGPGQLTSYPNFTWNDPGSNIKVFAPSLALSGDVRATAVFHSDAAIGGGPGIGSVLFAHLFGTVGANISNDSARIFMAETGGDINHSNAVFLFGNDAGTVVDSASVGAMVSFQPSLHTAVRSIAIASVSPSIDHTDMAAILASDNATMTTAAGQTLGSSAIIAATDGVIDGDGGSFINNVVLGGTGGSVTGVGNGVSINGGVVVNDFWTVVGGERMQVGSLPNGTLATGPFIVGVNAPTGTGAQAGLFQTTSEPPAGEGLVTLGQDNVAVSGWAFRGSTSTNPLYGGNFGVHFLGTGQTRGVEIDVQNEFADAGEGAFGEYVGLWLNRSGTYNASSAIEISSQDNRGWWHGIHFDPGGAGTGSDTLIKGWGIRWFRASSAQFISMVPADDFIPSANAIALYAFDSTTEKAKLTKRGQWWSRADDTSLVDPAFGFIDDPNTGMYQPAPDQLALGAGGIEVFKAVATPVVGTLTTGYMASVGTVFGSLGAVINGALIYCSDCTQTNPCGSGGTGAFALGINAAWDCSAAGAGGSGTVTGSGSTTQIAVWDAATDITGYADFLRSDATNLFIVGPGSSFAGAVSAAAIGTGNDITGGADTWVLGASNTVTGASSTGVGDGNSVTGATSFGVGATNVVSGNTAGAFGHTLTVSGASSSAFGANSTVASPSSQSFGAFNTDASALGNVVLVGQSIDLTGTSASNVAILSIGGIGGTGAYVMADGGILRVSLGISTTPELILDPLRLTVGAGTEVDQGMGLTTLSGGHQNIAVLASRTTAINGTANNVIDSGTFATADSAIVGGATTAIQASAIIASGTGTITGAVASALVATVGSTLSDITGTSAILGSTSSSIGSNCTRSVIIASTSGAIGTSCTSALVLGGGTVASGLANAVALTGGVVVASNTTVVGGVGFSTPGTIDIKQFGALGNGTNDDTAEIQAAIDAAEASGAEVFCSPGLYKTSAALTVTQPLAFRGTRGLAPSTLTGCIIIASNATQDIFNVSLPNTTSNPPYDFDGGAFVLEDVTLGASVVKTAGAGVFITNAGASCSGAILDKVAILDQWDGVDSDKACGVTIVNSRIAKWRNRGVHLENQSAVDGGSYRISGNYIFSLLGGAAIEWHSGGDMQITGNAIGTLGPYGIDITATNSGGGPSVATSMISVTGNEIESPSSAALNISAAAGQALTRVTATGNMMTCSGSGCSGIRTSEVTLGSVNSITMTGNVVSADNCFDVAGGDAVMISGNTCSTSWNGISVSAAALNVSAGENYIVAGSKVFNISNTTTSILTARPVTLTALPTAADGTRIWCSNCDPTATLLTCTSVGAATGAMAVRTAGTWKCIG